MHDLDHTQRFLFDDNDVRGEMVSLAESYQHVLAKHPYPQPVAQLLDAVSGLSRCFDKASERPVIGAQPLHEIVGEVGGLGAREILRGVLRLQIAPALERAVPQRRGADDLGVEADHAARFLSLASGRDVRDRHAANDRALDDPVERPAVFQLGRALAVLATPGGATVRNLFLLGLVALLAWSWRLTQRQSAA